MVKRAAAASVLFLAAGVAGCAKDPGEPSFPRAASTPAPVADQNVKDIVHAPLGGTVPDPNGRFEPMRPGGEVTEPVEIFRAEPDCRLLEGEARPIMVELIVTAEGAAQGARVLSQASAPARAAILDVVRVWRFRPSTFNGRAVPVYFTVALRRCP